MGSEPASPDPLAARPWASAAGLACAHVAAGFVGLVLVWPASGPAVFWPPAGVALGWLVRFGPAAWPGVLAGGLVMNAAAGGALGQAAAMAAASTVGALFGAWLVRRAVPAGFPLGTLRGVAAIAWAAALGAVPVAVVGPLSLAWEGRLAPVWGAVATSAYVWWLGDAAGVVLVAPAVLALRGGWPRWAVLTPTFLGMAALALLALSISLTNTNRRLSAMGPCLALAAWAAVRFGPRGVAVANLVTAGVVGLLVVQGHTPYPQSLAAFAVVFAVTALCLGAVTAERDADLIRRGVAEAELARREELLRAVGAAATRLLAGPTTADTLAPVLKLLGTASGVGRAYVLTLRHDGDEASAHLLHEWHADPSVTQARDLAAEPLPLRASGYGRWLDMLQQGDPVHGPVRDLPPGERPFLEGQNIRSILVAPIAAGYLWGVVGFEDCAADRVWSAGEVDALHTAAAALGAAVRRERTEDESRAVRERFAALLGHSHDVTAVLDPDGTVRFVSASVEKLTGFAPAAFDGRVGFDVIHPDDLPIARLLLADCLAQPGVPVRAEYRVRTAAGRWVWVESIGTNFVDYPPVGGVVLNSRDVTERRAADRALARSELRYRNLFENAPVAIWEEDFTAVGAWFDRLRADGVTDLAAYLVENPAAVRDAVARIGVTDVNRAGVALNGAADKDELVANLPHLFTPEAEATFAEELVALWNGARHVRLETRATKLSGGTVDVVMHLHVPVADGRPDLSQVVLIAFDVTEQKRLEGQFRQAAKLEAVGRLAGGIAHDFNNLLTVINGFAELLLQSAGDPAGREIAAQIHDAGLRAAGLTRQLLAFSRRQPVAVGDVDVRWVVAGLGPLLGPLLGEAVRLAVVAGPPVPPIRADHGQIEQVVMNLVVNARDAMPDGGAVTVSTGVVDLTDGPADEVPAGRYVVLAVADTGVGIPDAARSHIFEPFFTTKELGKGTGLGLSTVYGIVANAGGHVRFESEVGRGTTFRVYFPAATASEEVPVPTAPLLPIRAPAGVTVLLVEDEPAVRCLSETVLSEDGFDVLVAENGAAALALLAARPRVDLLVTDVAMPGMSGRVLADRVRELYPRVRVVFVSGYTPEAIRTDAGELFLPKPFGPDDLTRAVRELLGA